MRKVSAALLEQGNKLRARGGAGGLARSDGGMSAAGVDPTTAIAARAPRTVNVQHSMVIYKPGWFINFNFPHFLIFSP